MFIPFPIRSASAIGLRSGEWTLASFVRLGIAMQFPQNDAESAGSAVQLGVVCADPARLSGGKSMVVDPEMPKCRACPLPNVRDALPVSLARALDWLDARPDEPIRLEALAAVAGVRPRTLEAHFKLYLGTTP